ncbi:fumarylacetoacetate hydrolase family protein [Streptomyces sp. NPDC002130]|uniref:fumarylacetoacetate hydrolase family protein n=1 Tax=Streptomyces sp. NPDC002130 TaxID=3155568 RepID=UPI00331963A3
MVAAGGAVGGERSDAARSRARVLEVARRLVSEQGAEHLTMEAVAKSLGPGRLAGAAAPPAEPQRLRHGAAPSTATSRTPCGKRVADPEQARAAIAGYWCSTTSAIVTLASGDVIATGTPGGVGHARKPARYLGDGSVLVTRIEGIGECRNTCRGEQR